MTTQRTPGSADRSQIHRSQIYGSHSALNTRQSGELFRPFDTSSHRRSAHSLSLQSKALTGQYAGTAQTSAQTSARTASDRSTFAKTSPAKNHHRRRSTTLRNAGQNATAEWTVMVYMAGNSLESYAIQDFLELAAAGSDSKVNIVVQLDRTAGYDSSYGNWTDARRGLVKKGNTPNVNWGTSIGEVNMGSPSTLKNFVNWGTSTYKANHYALVMWGHGSGYNVSYDDATNDGISGGELNSALGGLSTKVDVVGTDACLMSTAEFASQISDDAAVFVGSQELEPGSGWNYTPVLQDLKTNPAMTAAQLGSSMVTRYGQTYLRGNETLSAVNLAALRSSNSSGLTQAIGGFATALTTSATSADLNTLDLWRDSLANVFDANSEPDNFCDVGKLFSSFASSAGISATLRLATQAVLNAYSSTVIQNYTAIVNRSTGLSLYFPDRGASKTTSYGVNYSAAINTLWGEFLNGAFW